MSDKVKLKNEFQHNGETVTIKIRCKGDVHDCLIDEQSFQLLSTMPITVTGSSEGAGIYAVFSISGKIKRLHRFLTEAQDGFDVDHINHNTLDNRLSNLRVCQHHENLQNIKRHKRSTSGYRNVSYYKPYGKWQVQMRINGKQRTIGYYGTAEEANEAAIMARKELMTHSVS